jgi:hypothetical protein
MNFLDFHSQRRSRAACGVLREFTLYGPVLVGLLGAIPQAFATPVFTDGTYISESVYPGGTIYSYATPGGFNYANGTPYQTNTVADPISPFSSATSTASLNPPASLSVTGNQLNMSLTAAPGGGYVAAAAEMWDTLTFGGLAPFGTGDYPGVTAATLTMTVVASAPAGVSASSAWGLETFDPGITPASGDDCGLVTTYYQCGYGYQNQSSRGTLEPNGSPTATFVAGTYTYSIAIPLDDLIHGENGQALYIAEIAAVNNGGVPLLIDPSITVTGLLSGLSVTSSSGYDYAPVPLPAAAWLLGSGLLGLACFGRRRYAPLLPRRTHS